METLVVVAGTTQLVVMQWTFYLEIRVVAASFTIRIQSTRTCKKVDCCLNNWCGVAVVGWRKVALQLTTPHTNDKLSQAQWDWWHLLAETKWPYRLHVTVTGCLCSMRILHFSSSFCFNIEPIRNDEFPDAHTQCSCNHCPNGMVSNSCATRKKILRIEITTTINWGTRLWNWVRETCESDYIFRPPLLGQRANHILRCKSLLRAGNETMRKEETEQNRLHISIASTKLAAVDGAPSKPKDENRKKPDRRRASAVSHAIEVSAMNGLANATNSLICPRSAKEMKVSHKLDRGLKFLFFTRKTLHCVVGRRAVPQHTDNETTFRSRSHFFFSFASTSTGDNTQFFISFEFFRRRSFVVAIASVSLSCSLCVRERLPSQDDFIFC